MHIIKTRAFIHTFSDIWKYSDRRLCFIVGNAASKASGIKTTDELAKLWLEEISSRMEDESGAYNEFLSSNKIDANNPAASYNVIFEERFKYDKTLGLEYLNKEVAIARPGYGHAVLAQILAEKHHNVVITTCFDNLIEEAIYTYTAKRPLVWNEESPKSFAPGFHQPLVFKVAGLTKQKIDLSHILTQLLVNSIPVFIGYDGNDSAGLMSYFEAIPAFENMFWCRQRGSILSGRVTSFIEGHDGKIVDIDGFDELMFSLQERLNLPVLLENVQASANRKIAEFSETVEKIKAQRAPVEATPGTPRTKAVEAPLHNEPIASNQRNIASQEPAIPELQVNNGHTSKTEVTHIVPDASKGEAWTVWEQKVKSSKNNEEREALYQKGLEVIPDSSELHINYAIFLQDVRKDYEAAEEHYKTALEVSPENANYNGNYAAFLYDIRKDYENAERYYKKAIGLDPNNANTNANYGVFLKNVRKDYSGAEKYYKTALEIDPHNPIYAVNYALFLKEVRKDYSGAESYFKKALAVDTENANTYGNYALFLKDVRKDYEGAEAYYKKAVEIKPESAAYLGNYASFLHYIRKDYDGAVTYYRKALQIDPNNAINTGNYANLLKHISKSEDTSENIFKTSFEFGPLSGNYKGNHEQLLKNLSRDYVGAEKHYRKALELDPNNATNNSNYAGFLKNVIKDYDQAEKHYKKALELAPDNADYNCNYAIFLKDIRQDYYGAQMHYKKALEIDPDNANNNGNYAGFLYAIGRDKQAWTFLDTALRNCTDDTLLAELHFYQYAHVPAERDKSLQLLKLLLSKGVRSIGFNLQPNVEGAIQDGHPDPTKLQLLADILTKDAPVGNL